MGSEQHGQLGIITPGCTAALRVHAQAVFPSLTY